MNKLYILGGPPRTGKTTLMQQLVAHEDVRFISLDAVQHGLRNILTGEPRQMLRNIELNGTAEYKASMTEGGEIHTFSSQGSESELMLKAVAGMIDYYDQNENSAAFEGALFTPEWVSKLSTPNFAVKAAFVGYTNASQADSIISYAQSHPHDWINHWLRSESGDEIKLRQWVAGVADGCRDLREDAEKYGFPFFDLSAMQFPDYCDSIRKYFRGA